MHSMQSETTTKPLRDLVQRFNSGEILLPQFQRDDVWRPSSARNSTSMAGLRRGPVILPLQPQEMKGIPHESAFIRGPSPKPYQLGRVLINCPLCPQKRTFASALSMSALCH
jgi:hypothetical protein